MLIVFQIFYCNSVFQIARDNFCMGKILIVSFIISVHKEFFFDIHIFININESM